MTGSSSTTIYNATDGPLAIDRAGRMIAAGEERPVEDLEASPLAGHIAATRIVVVDGSPGEDDAESDASDDAPADPQPTTTRTRRGRASTQEA